MSKISLQFLLGISSAGGPSDTSPACVSLVIITAGVINYIVIIVRKCTRHPTDLFYLVFQASSTLLLLWPGDEDLGEDADLLLSSIMAQGLPTPVHVVTDLEEMGQKVWFFFSNLP